MSSFAQGSSASPDVSAMIASVGQAAAADQAQEEHDLDAGGQPDADPSPAQTPEPSPEPAAPAPPPASSTIRQPEPTTPPTPQTPEPSAQQAGTVSDFLGMDAAAIDRLVGALSTQQTPPGAGGPSAPVSPSPSPAAPAQPAPQSSAQTPDLRFVSDEQIDAQADIIGDEGVALLKQMAASQRAMHEHYERQMADARGAVDYYRAQESKQIETTVGGFFGGMKDLGLDQKYGTGPVPTTPEQAQARMALGETADRVWKAMGGKPDTLEQALKTAVFITDRQAVEQSIASRARSGVRESLQKRRGIIDATPGGSGGPSAPPANDPDKAGIALASGFVQAQRG